MIPDRATGRLHFVLKWASGGFSGHYIESMSRAIRLFTEKLRQAPPAERELAYGHLDAEVRKSGGIKHATLAKWTATQPLASFFQEACAAWRCLPKERDDFRRSQSDETIR